MQEFYTSVAGLIKAGFRERKETPQFASRTQKKIIMFCFWVNNMFIILQH